MNSMSPNKHTQDAPYKRFQSQGHQNEHERYICYT